MPSSSRIGPLAIGRLVIALGVLAAGLVAVLPHRDALMWQASIITGEGGHWLGGASIIFLFGWRWSWLHKLAVALTALGIALLFVPLVQAYQFAAPLPEALRAAFGEPLVTSTTHDPARPAPLVPVDLVFGVNAGEVIVDEHVYDVVDGHQLTLDLYRPQVEVGPKPVVVVIHGGGWTDGNKRQFTTLSRYLASRGYIVAKIAYRLAPGSRFPAPLEDLGSAIRYIKNLETTHGVDPTRFAFVGRSAGAQIAMLAAYTMADPAIRGAVSFYGPTELRWGYENPAKMEVVDSSFALEQYLGGPPATHGEQYDAAEPGQFATAASPPTLLIHGLRDEHVARFHAESLSGRLSDLGVPHFIVEMPWATHGCDYIFSGPCGQVTTYAVERFLGSVLRGAPTTNVRETTPLPTPTRSAPPPLEPSA